MKFFKNTTWAMPVIMGRKTFDSIGKKPLKGRFNIVVTRSNEVQSENGEIILAPSLDEAIKKAEETDCKESFVIGGGEIYKEILPRANKVYLTRVHSKFEGDTFFPELDENWKLRWREDHPADEKHTFAYSFELWER